MPKLTPRLGVCVLLVAATALSACGNRNLRANFGNKKQEVLFDGVKFKTKAKAVSKDTRDHFTVTVSRANQSLNGAKAAGGYEGIRYCIKDYGTSNIDWLVGPENESIIPVDDKIQLEGFCRP